jgi:hypothetical protein
MVRDGGEIVHKLACAGSPEAVERAARPPLPGGWLQVSVIACEGSVVSNECPPDFNIYSKS